MRALTMARPSRGTDGHMTARSARRRFILGGSALLFAACAPGGAPSFDFFGAYFPAWLPFAVLAILLALLTRGLMILRPRSALAPSAAAQRGHRLYRRRPELAAGLCVIKGSGWRH